MRDFSAFKDWHFRKLNLEPGKVIVWTETRCEECWTTLCHVAYTVTAADAELLASGVIRKEGYPIERSYQPFAGGPILCNAHYSRWLHGKVLPSEDQRV